MTALIETKECTCHKFIQLHDGECAVHGRVRKQEPQTEERHELQKDAASLAYTAIGFSGLRRKLTNDERVAMADNLGVLVLNVIESAVDDQGNPDPEAQVEMMIQELAYERVKQSYLFNSGVLKTNAEIDQKVDELADQITQLVETWLSREVNSAVEKESGNATN